MRAWCLSLRGERIVVWQTDEIWGVQRGEAPAPVLSLPKGREPESLP